MNLIKLNFFHITSAKQAARRTKTPDGALGCPSITTLWRTMRGGTVKSFQVKDLVSRSRLRYAEISVQYESLKLGSVDEELHLKGTETTVDYVTQGGKIFCFVLGFFFPQICV